MTGKHAPHVLFLALSSHDEGQKQIIEN
ncbi:hypothetical protein EVA_04066, partial [gut metagenome]